MDIRPTKRRREAWRKQEIQKQCWRRRGYIVNENNNETVDIYVYIYITSIGESGEDKWKRF